MTAAREVNFDALVGPTHNYAGLAYGNLASQQSRSSLSNPKAAALEGLTKMKLLMDLGMIQGILPPQERPDVGLLRRLGFAGDDAQVLENAHRADPRLLAAASSASSMWAANAATVSPSADTADGRVHFTPANLISHLHRSIEPPTTAAIFRAIFPDETHFAHHPPLPPSTALSDEGAANHMRLCRSPGEAGLEIFVYGRGALRSTPSPGTPGEGWGEGSRAAYLPHLFPARQTLESSQSIARLHELSADHVLFLHQSPAAIDAGVFHNDVIAVSNQNVLLCHGLAFAEPANAFSLIRNRFAQVTGEEAIVIIAEHAQVSLEDAVRSYIFNSQLITLPDGTMSLIAPTDCLDYPSIQRFIDQTIAADNPIASVHYIPLRQSMRNGGGPACLRLRVVLTAEELSHIHPGVLLTDALYRQLTAWIERHYRDHLAPDDLADVQLLTESRTALDELASILTLPALYRFPLKA